MEKAIRRKTSFSPSNEQDKRQVKEWILNCIKRSPGISPLQISEAIGIPCTAKGNGKKQPPSIVAICVKELRAEGAIKHTQRDRRGYYLDSHEEPIKSSLEQIKEINMRGVTTYYVPVAQLSSALDQEVDIAELSRSNAPSQPIAVRGKGRTLA